MPKFTISMEVTERTVEEIEIEADTAAEALQMVEEYQFDNSNTRFVDSIEWSIQNAKLKETGNG